MSATFYLTNTRTGIGPYSNQFVPGMNLYTRWNYYNNASGYNAFSGIKQTFLSTDLDPQRDSGLVHSTIGYTNTSGQTGIYPNLFNRIFVSKVIPTGVTIDSLYSGQVQAANASGYASGSYTSGAFIHYGHLTLMDKSGNYAGTLATFQGDRFFQIEPLTNRTIVQNFIDSGKFINQTGMRLCLELGVKLMNNTTGIYMFKQVYGRTTAGDLPIDQASQQNLVPWLTINNNLF